MAVVACYVSSLLTMPVFGSLGSEWLVHFCVFSLLTMPVLGSPVCEWLWYIAMFIAC